MVSRADRRRRERELAKQRPKGIGAPAAQQPQDPVSPGPIATSLFTYKAASRDWIGIRFDVPNASLTASFSPSDARQFATDLLAVVNKQEILGGEEEVTSSGLIVTKEMPHG